MNNFERVAAALHYIDDHISEELTFKHVADIFHFSPFYFHRLFSAIVGKTITAYIRDRRLEQACRMLAYTEGSIISICVDCGFDSSQAFSRVFRNNYGVSPSEYRRSGLVPVTLSVEEMIMRFTNRLKGGILVHPRLVKREKLLIAGLSGDGRKTGKLWQDFSELNKKIGMGNKLSDNGFEVRIYDGNECRCHVGLLVADRNVEKPFQLVKLPAALYASFDVYVAKGYDSENSAMDQWLEGNSEIYEQVKLDGNPYVVEFYDERFNGNSSDSIVEIWLPIRKKRGWTPVSANTL